ncbi:ATP-NAD kinase-like domain-containing protein [Phycomyces nitens]|nr:ATP-NAD kinase-like domain-containing protein [Phycomyces nitens]
MQDPTDERHVAYNIPNDIPVSTPNTFVTAQSYSLNKPEESSSMSSTHSISPPQTPTIHPALVHPKDMEAPIHLQPPSPEETPRPSVSPTGGIEASVCLEDTETEGRPSIYLFIFVNPLSGDRKGSDLINLPIQHFRLRRLPQVQVEIHNILDDEDRMTGLEQIKLIENMVKTGQIPPIPPQDSDVDTTDSPDSLGRTSKRSSTKADKSSIRASRRSSRRSSRKTDRTSQTIKLTQTEPEGLGKLSDAVRTRQIQVWSAGGDGTVMSVFELLVSHSVDLDLIFFSCIPFGTGNDFSQVLGWGRTVPNKDILGFRLHNLEQLVTERLENSDAARLDIWQVDMIAHESGYVRQSGPERDDGHDVAEIKNKQQDRTTMIRKMSNYMSIGVQGYVGSGFEDHRAGKRLMNMFVYASESSKWVFFRHFPPVTRFIESIVKDQKTVLKCPPPPSIADSTPKDTPEPNEKVPRMTKHPIDFVIQNIPHIWGREVDLWGEAESGLEVVEGRSGPTDPDTWNPQLANDGKMEIMVIDNLFSYFKKLANIRSHVSRVGQFETEFEINFRPPHKPEGAESRSLWTSLKKRIIDIKKNKYERDNIVCIMCDGEFYTIKDPKVLKFNRFAQISTLGRSDEISKGRLVADELTHQEEFGQGETAQ